MLRNIGQGSFHGEFSFFDSHGVDDPLVIELFQKEDSTVFYACYMRLYYVPVVCC